jgi:hemoglobin
MESLYEKIGEKNIQLLVNTFYEHVFASPIIAPLFKTDKEEIKRKQQLFLTQFLGGPQMYSREFGHPRMRMRHLPHEITEEAKNEWLRCMKLAVGGLDIEDRLKEELFAVFPKLAAHMVNS